MGQFHQKANWSRLAMILLFGWYGHSCQTTPTKQNAEGQFDLQNEETYDPQTPGSSSRRNTKLNLKITHPKKPDAWSTRKSIMVNAQPAPGDILECKETAESVALNATNLRSLDEGALSLTGKVSGSPVVYHWCFYQLMTDLDLRLERDSPLLTEKSEAFLSRMKVLWVLATALDDSTDKRAKNYSSYLRTRYIEISQTHFGRTIEVMDPEGIMHTAGKEGKAAGPYEGP